jgi:hypothetical protein
MNGNCLVISSWWDLSEKDGSSTQITNLIILFQKIFKKTYFIFPNKKGLIKNNPKVHFKQIFNYPGYFFNYSLGYFLDYNIFFQKVVDYTISKYKIDIVFISFPWGIRYIRKKYPEMKIIYGANGYEREFAKISWGFLIYPARTLISHLIGLQESYAIKNCDLIISVGESLTKELELNFEGIQSKIATIKMGFTLNFANKRNFNKKLIFAKYGLDPKKKYFIFHGAKNHKPNFEAAELIVNKIAPYFTEKYPLIQFCIVGKGFKRISVRNIHFYPFIEDLDEFFQIMTGAVMPIISGSGIRIKAIDYIKNGIPIISTKKGIEGYGFKKSQILITPNLINNEFLDGILKIAFDSNYTKNLSENMIEFVKKELDNKILTKKLKNILIEKSILRMNPY